LAGEFGAPVIFGSGDNVFVQENRGLFPRAEFVTVKTTNGHGTCESVSPSKARSLLAAGAQAAMGRINSAPLFTLPAPIICRVQVQSPMLADLFSQLPTLRRIDGVALEFSEQSVQNAIRMLNCLSVMSLALKP
jgi:D-amino peptidase